MVKIEHARLADDFIALTVDYRASLAVFQLYPQPYAQDFTTLVGNLTQTVQIGLGARPAGALSFVMLPLTLQQTESRSS